VTHTPGQSIRMQAEEPGRRLTPIRCTVRRVRSLRRDRARLPGARWQLFTPGQPLPGVLHMDAGRSSADPGAHGPDRSPPGVRQPESRSATNAFPRSSTVGCSTGNRPREYVLVIAPTPPLHRSTARRTVMKAYSATWMCSPPAARGGSWLFAERTLIVGRDRTPAPSHNP